MKSVKALLEEFSVKEGDKVRVRSGEEEFVGKIIPSKKNSLNLKLDNGYNVGIEAKKIDSIKKIGSEKRVGKASAKKTKQDSELPLISILHTGGTIASRVDYKTGGVIASFTTEDILSMFPELTEHVRIDSVLIGNIMSEDLRFKHYKQIARAIEKEIKKGARGIIVTHGTDTMHYTAAALSFMFEELPVPTLLVGAQRSSDRPSSDAAMNLLGASRFITQSDFGGVGICMHSNTSDKKCNILPGTKTRKLHSSRRDAFQPVNSKPIAEIDWNSGKIEFLSDNYRKKSGDKKVKILDKFEERVGILKGRPNMHPEEFSFFEENNYKGLILEATGIGQMPINTKENKQNKKALKSLIDSGCIVGVTSQCIFGRVHENIYTNCRHLKELGTIFLEDMTSETAFIKLSWLLGNFNQKKASELLNKNLRGEISKRRLIEEFGPGE